jgi:protease I
MLSHELVADYHVIPAVLRDSLVGESYLLPEFDDPGPDSLIGFRVALVTTHGSELPEFHVPLRYLRDRGASVEVVTQDWLFDPQKAEASGMVVLVQFLAVNVCVKADKKISDAKIGDYDAVIILGGAWNPIMLRTDPQVLRFIGEAHKRRILIASLCHGPQVLISTKAFPAGTRMTGVTDIRGDLTNAGFVVEDRPVVYDEREQLITSPSPQAESLKAFCEEIGKYAHRLVVEKMFKQMEKMMFKQTQWAVVVLGLWVIEAALLYKLITGQAATGVIGAICFVGILLMLSLNVHSLRLISFGKEGLRAELEVLQNKTSENDRAITDLFILSMGPDAYRNLRKLATGNFGQYKKERHMGLETELYHLRNLGYVVLNNEKARSIYEIPESGDQLSEYVRVTEAGKRYIALRENRA